MFPIAGRIGLASQFGPRSFSLPTASLEGSFRPRSILLPLAALLSGWGLLTIWRLNSAFGIRQNNLADNQHHDLDSDPLSPFRPIDSSTLQIYSPHQRINPTALTILLGTNPQGYGANRWLGCCGIYLQPSEPLKLLLVVYLSAYLSDHKPFVCASSPTPPYSFRHRRGDSTSIGST